MLCTGNIMTGEKTTHTIVFYIMLCTGNIITGYYLNYCFTGAVSFSVMVRIIEGWSTLVIKSCGSNQREGD